MARIEATEAGRDILGYYRTGKDYHSSDCHLFWGNIRYFSNWVVRAWHRRKGKGPG